MQKESRRVTASARVEEDRCNRTGRGAFMGLLRGRVFSREKIFRERICSDISFVF